MWPRPGNHQILQVVKYKVIRTIDECYKDFGPTLAREKLEERHNLVLSTETVRQLMILNRLWVAKPKKRHPLHMRRPRRAAFGELIQMDASFHNWFEERGPKCALLVLIDDATSRVMHLLFVPTECLEG